MAMTKRNPAMDILRCFALFCVIGVHFFMNIGFYDETVTGFHMSVMVYLRSFFMICVPLFLALSGFLMRNVRLSGVYYTRIIKIYLTYCVSGVLCILYQILFMGEHLGPVAIICLFLSFDAAPYAWYINMYIGLFLLIPFLNTLYNGIEKQSHKQLLIGSMLFLTALPAVVNVYQINNLQWWRYPAASSSYHILMPYWWTSIYPITYYFIGCYLSEFPLKLRQSLKFLLILAAALLTGTYNLYRSHSALFVFGPWADYGSLLTVLLTVLVFSFIQGMELSKLDSRVCTLLKKMSNLCLEAYLISWIPDQFFYKLLIAHQPAVPLRLRYFLLIVPAIYIVSLLLSAVINRICDPLNRIILSLTSNATEKASAKR